ncbi:MAG: hypothetical protein CVU56_28910, partial [Deltaproteobacteria bacterium HGW-Deltaproteobacteria-14]
MAAAGVAAEKARYAERLRALQAVVAPPLTNAELSIGLELDPAHAHGAGVASQVGRFLSVAPRNRNARPDRATRAIIDRLVSGEAVLCVRAAMVPGLPREVLVCEPRETARLDPDWTAVRLGALPLPALRPACPADDDDDFGEADGAADGLQNAAGYPPAEEAEPRGQAALDRGAGRILLVDDEPA